MAKVQAMVQILHSPYNQSEVRVSFLIMDPYMVHTLLTVNKKWAINYVWFHLMARGKQSALSDSEKYESRSPHPFPCLFLFSEANQNHIQMQVTKLVKIRFISKLSHFISTLPHGRKDKVKCHRRYQAHYLLTSHWSRLHFPPLPPHLPTPDLLMSFVFTHVWGTCLDMTAAVPHVVVKQ